MCNRNLNNNIDYDNDPRLNIVSVAEQCGVLVKKPVNSNRYVGICPFCGDITGHLYLTLKDGKYNNVYRCAKCGSSGSSVKLYAELHGLDTKQAFKELMGFDKQTAAKRVKKVKVETEKIRVNQNKVKSIDERHKVYSALLNKLTLRKEHYENLLKRGLSVEDIENEQYRSIPENYEDRRMICKSLIKEGLELKGIPGFYLDEDKFKKVICEKLLSNGINIENKKHFFVDKESKEKAWAVKGDIKSALTELFNNANEKHRLIRMMSIDLKVTETQRKQITEEQLFDVYAKCIIKNLDNYWNFKYTKGFLISIRDEKNRIEGFQIRRDFGKPKYLWFSSGKENQGTRCYTWISVHWNSKKSSEKVVITEGPLKGKIASKYSDTTFVSVAGVNSFKGLVDKLNKIGANKDNVHIAYDMDYRDKPEVQKALESLQKYLSQNGYKPNVSKWNSAYKGIDEYLVYLKTKKAM